MGPFIHANLSHVLLKCLHGLTPLFVFTLLSLPLCRVQAAIEISNFGVNKVKSNDLALVFYATATHSGTKGDAPVVARLRMEKCCQQVFGGINDCNIMNLIGGLGIVMHPNESSTLNMYFVNPDLYDREGSCVLRLLTRTFHGGLISSNNDGGWDTGRDLTIPFKTVLPEPSLLRKLFISAGGSCRGFRVCSKDNQNAIHECANDDCQIRYCGQRSIHNQSTSECDPTPSCTDSRQNMLSPSTGKCESKNDLIQLQSSFSREMRIPLLSPDDLGAKPRSIDLGGKKVLMPSVTCEHGTLVNGSNGHQNCTCDPDWTSLTPEEWERKGGVIKHAEDGAIVVPTMCNIPLSGNTWTHGLLIIGLIHLCILIPFFVFLLYKMAQRRVRSDPCNPELKSRKREDTMDQLSSSEEEDGYTSHELQNEDGGEDADAMILEIMNRREPKPKSGNPDDDPPPQPSFVSSTWSQDTNLPPPPPPPSLVSSTWSRSQQELSNLSYQASRTRFTQSEMGPPTTSASHFPPSLQPSQLSGLFQEAIPHQVTKTTLTPSEIDQLTNSMLHFPPSPQTSQVLGHSLQQNQVSQTGLTPPEMEQPTTSTSYFPFSQPPPLSRPSLQETPSQGRSPSSNAMPAKRILSTDELLTMTGSEMGGAHIPIRPVLSSTGLEAAYALLKNIESRTKLNNNTADTNVHHQANVTRESGAGTSVSSLSSEEITLRKKIAWHDYIKSASSVHEQQEAHESKSHISLLDSDIALSEVYTRNDTSPPASRASCGSVFESEEEKFSAVDELNLNVLENTSAWLSRFVSHTTNKNTP